MAKTKPKFWIILSGEGGELDRVPVLREDEIKSALDVLVSDTASFHAGDTITIVEAKP